MNDTTVRRPRVSDFDYAFPETLIAQRPLGRRSESRLMVLDRNTSTIGHRRFGDIVQLAQPGDLFVINESKVIKARLEATRDNGRPAEVLLVHPEPDGSWLAMVHPGGKLKPGRTVYFGTVGTATIVDILGGGLRRIRFDGADVQEVIDHFGTVPLPPYISRPADAEDAERYQTVFARDPGSIAAPTAGLHFDEETMQALRARGVAFAPVTLHVGPGTFKPVEVDDPAEHRMHSEWYSVSGDAARRINETRNRGNRVWAIGTTAARVLETVTAGGVVTPGTGWTDLFIYPPHRFQSVDVLLTNFHLPRSTLIMLVAAFAGYDLTMNAYRDAVTHGYRLFSYGDAMVVT